MLKHPLLPAILVTTTLSLACGQGAPSAQQFTGLWAANGSATYTFNTPDGPATTTNPVSGENRDIVAGATNPNQIVLGWEGCELPATVIGNIATVPTGQQCTLNSDQATLTLEFTTGTASVQQNTMNITLSGNLTEGGNGSTYFGSFTDQEALTKIGK